MLRTTSILFGLSCLALVACGSPGNRDVTPLMKPVGGTSVVPPQNDDTEPAAADLSKSKALYDQAYAAAVKGEFTESARLFQESLAADPNNVLATFDLGGLYEATGDKDKAIEYYLRAAKLEPTFIEAHNQAATLLLTHKQKPHQAIAHWKLVVLLQEKPFIDKRFSKAHTMGQTYSNLAVAYAVQGMVGLAQGIARSYLNNPSIDHGNAAQMLAMVRQTAADIKRADKRVHAGELASLSKTLYGGAPQLAKAGYVKFEKAHPEASLSGLDRWDLLSGLAMANAMLGDNTAAETLFAKAVAAADGIDYAKRVESQFNLACALSSQGKVDAALEQADLVLWSEIMTRYDPKMAAGRRKAAKLSTDPTLAAMRKHQQFKKLLDRYSAN